MRKIVATAVATSLIAAASVAATTAPASAGFYFGLGHGFGFHGYHGYGYTPHVYVEAPVYDEDDSGWDQHAAWCSRYKTWDEDTNLYYYAVGKQRPCISPYGPN